LFVRSRKRHGRIGFGLGSPSASFGVWVVVADGVSVDEVDERTDADSGTTEDHDNMWFGALENRRESENGSEKG